MKSVVVSEHLCMQASVDEVGGGEWACAYAYARESVCVCVCVCVRVRVCVCVCVHALTHILKTHIHTYTHQVECEHEVAQATGVHSRQLPPTATNCRQLPPPTTT